MSPSRSEARATAVVLLGCFVCQMGLGCGYVFGATLKHIVGEFEWSRTAFAAASAPLLLAMGLAAPLVGSMTGRFGARRVIASAVLVLGLALWAFGRMQSLWQFYLASALFGVGLTGVGDIAVGAVASAWVRGRRGLALAVVFVGSNVGGAIVPVAAETIAAQASWRVAVQSIGAAVVLLVLPFALFAIRMPAEAAARGARDASSSDTADQDLTLAEALRTRSFWILAAVLFVFYTYYLAVNQHLIAFLSDVGFSNARAAASLSFAVLLGVAGKLAAGVLADRGAPRRVFFADLAVLTAAAVLLMRADLPGILPVFLVAHGLATAAENVLMPLLVVECFGPAHFASIFGALTVALFPGGVLGPVIAAAIYDAWGDYRPAFALFAAMLALGLVGVTRLRRERKAGPGTALSGGGR